MSRQVLVTGGCGYIGSHTIRAALATYPDIAGVIHFAAYIESGESMEKPDKYFENNAQSTEYLLGQRDNTRARQVLGRQPRYGPREIIETS